MSEGNDKDVSLKGLDEYAKQFLIPSDDDTPDDIKIDKEEARPELMKQYLKQQKTDFIRRAGGFTEDLVGFIVDQKGMRSLDDRTVVFALALASINLRHSFMEPQNSEERETFNSSKRKELEKEWGAICWAAQCYFNENI